MMDIKKGSQPPIDMMTKDQSRLNKNNTKINTKRTKSNKSSSSTQRTNKMELYREVESFSLADTFNSTTIRLFLSLGDQLASNLGKFENILSSWQLILKSKIERDIKLTEKFGQYISRRASKGFGSVASTSAESFSKTFKNETSQTWGLMRLRMNPFDATSLTFRGGGGGSKFVGGFDATTSTKEKIKRTKNRQNEAKGSVIPLLPSSVYNTIRTLPNKLQYDYQRRVIARETKRNLDLYDTQQQYMLPTTTASSANSRNRDSRFMDDESSATSMDNNILRNAYYDGDEMFVDEGDDDSDFVEDYNTVSSEELLQLSRIRLQSELDTINQLLSMPLKQFIDMVLDDTDSHSLSILKQEFEWTLHLTEECLEEKMLERETVHASLLSLQSQQQQQHGSALDQVILESTDTSSPTAATSVIHSNVNENIIDSETTTTATTSTPISNQQQQVQQQSRRQQQDQDTALLLSQLTSIDIDIDALLAAKSLLQQATDTTVNFSTLKMQVYNAVVQNIDPSILFNTQSNEVISTHSTTDDNSMLNVTVDDSNNTSSTPDSSVTSSDMRNAEAVNNNTTNSNTITDPTSSSSPPSPTSVVTLSLDLNQLVIVKEALNSILLSWNQVVVSSIYSDSTSDSTSNNEDASTTFTTVGSTSVGSINDDSTTSATNSSVSGTSRTETTTTSVGVDKVVDNNAAIDDATNVSTGDNFSDIKNRIKQNKLILNHVFEVLNTVIATEKNKNERLFFFLRQNKNMLQTLNANKSDIDKNENTHNNSINSNQSSKYNDVIIDAVNNIDTAIHTNREHKDNNIVADNLNNIITDTDSEIKILSGTETSSSMVIGVVGDTTVSTSLTTSDGATTATDDDYEIEIDIYGDVTYIPRRSSNNNSTKTNVSTGSNAKVSSIIDDFTTTAIDPVVIDTVTDTSSHILPSAVTAPTSYNTTTITTSTADNHTLFNPIDFNEFYKNTYKTKILNNNNTVFVLDKLPLLTVENVVNLYTYPTYQEMLLKYAENSYYTGDDEYDDDYVKERKYDKSNNNNGNNGDNNRNRNVGVGGVILDAAAGDVTISETKEKQLAQFILVSLDVTLFLLESLVRAVVPVLSGTAGNMLTNAQSALELGQPNVKELVIIWNKYDRINFYIPSTAAAIDKATPSSSSTTVPGSISINKVTTSSLIDDKNALLLLSAFEKQIELRNKLRTVPQSWKMVVRYEVVDIIASNNNNIIINNNNNNNNNKDE